MPQHRLLHVSVTLDGPDDGGDSWPGTSGTRTSGLQEALDDAHGNCRDVCIHGVRMDRPHAQQEVTS